MSWKEWGDQERRRFLAVADVLLPGTDSLPSATEAVLEDQMDDAVRLRSDVEEVVRGLLRRDEAAEPEALVESIASPVEIEALMILATGAYCMTRTVWDRLGYAGQEAREVRDDTEANVDLLLPVFERGPLFRPTPRA